MLLKIRVSTQIILCGSYSAQSQRLTQREIFIINHKGERQTELNSSKNLQANIIDTLCPNKQIGIQFLRIQSIMMFINNRNNQLPVPQPYEQAHRQFQYQQIKVNIKLILILSPQPKVHTAEESMNLSPSRIVGHQNQQQPLLQHQQPLGKPRVAFTYHYQNGAPQHAGNIVAMGKNLGAPEVTTLVGINKEMGVVVTPKKVDDKQNTYRSQMFTKLSPSSFQLQENTTNSPQLMKLPPLSPKLLNKKAQSKCPSFLVHKVKNQQQPNQTAQVASPCKNATLEPGTKCQCGKPTTHQLSSNQGYCSKCGIEKMLQGYELKPLPTFGQPRESINVTDLKAKEEGIELKIEKGLAETSKSLILQKLSTTSTQSIKIERLLKQVGQQKQLLSSNLKEALESEQQNISQYYKERKQELKAHYEKIKSAIKESIEQDIKQLETSEKEQIGEWRRSANNMQEDLKRLEKIEMEAKDLGEKKIEGARTKEELFSELREINRVRRAGSKLGIAQADTINVSRISSILSPRSQKNSNLAIQVYKPQTYRLMDLSIKSSRSGRSSDLFLIPQVNAKEKEKKQCKNTGNGKNLLFSFEGKK